MTDADQLSTVNYQLSTVNYQLKKTPPYDKSTTPRGHLSQFSRPCRIHSSQNWAFYLEHAFFSLYLCIRKKH